MSELARIETRRSGPAQVVDVVGELDLSNSQELADAVARDVPDEVTLVVLDLSGTTYVDSATIATLFRLSARLRDRRQELRLVVPTDSPIRAVLELTRLTHVIQVDEQPYAAPPPTAAAATPQPSPETTVSDTGPGAEPEADTQPGPGSGPRAPGGPAQSSG